MDEDKSDSKITMEIVQEIANSINPMIKLTCRPLVILKMENFLFLTLYLMLMKKRTTE